MEENKTMKTAEPTATETQAQLEARIREEVEKKYKKYLDEATSDASKWKKELQAKQSAEERAAAERAELEAKYEKLVRQNREISLASKLSFIEDTTLAQSIARQLSEGDFEGAISALATNYEGMRANTEKTVRQKLMGNNATPPPVTKPATPAWSSLSLDERAKLKETDPALYETIRPKK